MSRRNPIHFYCPECGRESGRGCVGQHELQQLDPPKTFHDARAAESRRRNGTALPPRHPKHLDSKPPVSASLLDESRRTGMSVDEVQLAMSLSSRDHPSPLTSRKRGAH